MKHYIFHLTAALLLGSATTTTCFAGKPQKWEDVPEAVRKTILANGGSAGSVDKEPGKNEGQAIYEIGIKNSIGAVSDLVVRADGKLIEVKTDDASDYAQEQATRAKKLLDGVKFTHPRDITHPFLPLSSLQQDILEGTEDGKKVRIERTAMPQKAKAFTIAGQRVEAFVMEDREFENGELAEIATDYFAQDDNGTVYYLGEEVDEYENGKVTGHSGAWMLGKDTQVPGVILPGRPKVGDQFKTEDVSAEIDEADQVVSLTESVTVPAGTFNNCVTVREKLADGSTEFKYYAKGVGVVREIPGVGDVVLISHNGKAVK